jgi:Protein of unknown function (DUF4242)
MERLIVETSSPKRCSEGADDMPRYVVQRTFADGVAIPVSEEGAKTCQVVVEKNADLDVTWVHSYVSKDKNVTYCVYDGPSPEAIRRAAEVNGLPVDQITEVTVLDPYFYR